MKIKLEDGRSKRSRARQLRQSREEVRLKACPTCLVAPGQACIGARGKIRASNHMDRALGTT